LIRLDQQSKTGGPTAKSVGEGLDGKAETRPDDKQMIAEAIGACRSSLDENDISALAGIITEESKKYDYDWELILAIIRTESHFNTRAKSNKGARGLMQVLPSTAKWLSPKMGLEYGGRESLYDPEYNVKLGTRYLHMLHQKFGNIEKAIVAYNRGPNGLTRYLRQGRKFPPKYLVKVMDYYKELKDGSSECAS
jgi:soluble lytic murein transglycosylase-like protein